MSGHSKWSTIKRKKGAEDAKRANTFTKLANVIIVAARVGRGLDLAVERARAANMPKDKIEHAILRGQGKIAGSEVMEVIYEAYGPGGIAVLIKVLTDNKNRILSNIRALFNKIGARLAESGSVSYLFEQKGVVEINLQNQAFSHEDLEMIIIDSGAEDYEEDNERIYVYTSPKKLEEVKKNIEFKAIKIDSAKLEMIPKTYIEVADNKKETIVNFLTELEELDDVDEVYTNADL